MRWTIEGSQPVVDSAAWVAPTAFLAGDVALSPHASIWFGAVLRAEGGVLRVRDGANVQDGSVLHADEGFELIVGRDVTVGHAAVLHGCVIEDSALIGMGSIVLNGATVGAGSLLAAGSLVPEGRHLEGGFLYAGSPARQIRELKPEEQERIRWNADHYRTLAKKYSQAQAEEGQAP